jgi:hypothetical protein
MATEVKRPAEIAAHAIQPVENGIVNMIDEKRVAGEARSGAVTAQPANPAAEDFGRYHAGLVPRRDAGDKPTCRSPPAIFSASSHDRSG